MRVRQLSLVVAFSIVIASGRSSHAQAPAPPAAAPTARAMGLVPAGDFWMGRVRMWMIDEIGWQVRERADDRPVHLVYLDAFQIDTHEVTAAEYAEYVKATGAAPPYHWGGPTPPPDRADVPIYNVSWHDAVAYCGWRGKRLPTEAEWEKAARGGLDRQDFPWGMDYETPAEETTAKATSAIADPDVGDRDSTAASPVRPGAENMVSHAWSNSAHGPTRVGTYEANGYGLYDMSGNVWEWTSNWYDLFAYSTDERRNPTGPGSGIYKVIRGGGWLEDDSRLGSVYIRNFANPDLKTPTIGFRCAQSAPSATRY